MLVDALSTSTHDLPIANRAVGAINDVPRPVIILDVEVYVAVTVGAEYGH